ncbi:MAG: hypothetical protein CM15mP111_2440 [Hyphomicrobiales bacterium]|nr:MAG: hypothetical protein CM15mP111_2440 [Hyphomicrobiales bacterium]
MRVLILKLKQKDMVKINDKNCRALRNRHVEGMMDF